MDFYDRMAATAVRLIALRGAPIILTRAGSAAYDVDEGVVDSTPETYEGKAIRTEYKASDVDGTLIQQGDERLVISTDGTMVKPEPGDKLTYDDETFSVIDCETKRPATTTIVYIVQARKG